ncbi:MAG: hypothetical protein OXG30_16995, partial [bacterium]|nr:hypothetical protein [bacterium]
MTLLFGLFGDRRPRGAVAALAVVAGLLVSLLSAAGTGAQPASEAHTPPPPQEIEQRDQLIADQE